MNWPNRITVFRIVLVPVFIITVHYHQFRIALLVFVLAALTDALDGYLARVFDARTRLGTIMDPIADKMLVGSAFVSLALITGIPEHLQMPGYVPIIVVSRDVLILTGAALLHLVTGKVEIKPSIVGKMTTFVQMATITVVLLRWRYSMWVWNLAVILTIISGLDYIRRGSRALNGSK